MSADSNTKRRAPVSSYLLMVAVGALLSSAVATVIALMQEDQAVLAFVLTVVMTLPAALALGWVLFVSGHVTEPDPHAEDNVEIRWLEKAAFGTCTDVFVTVSIGAAVLTIAGDRLDLDSGLVLLAVGLLLASDLGLRYSMLRRRATAGADA